MQIQVVIPDYVDIREPKPDLLKIWSKYLTRSARGGEIINTLQIPFWERYTLTIQEASQYFRIGETKLRKIVSENKDADFVLWNGTRPQIKRTKFERFVDQLNLI